MKYHLRLSQRRFEEALVECRLHLSWYILCHRAHTLPLLKSGGQEGQRILAVDIEAMAGIVRQLYTCYRQVGRIDEFNSVLDNLENSIVDKRWHERVVYFRALWWMNDRSDRDKARECISNIVIANCADTYTLTLYVDLNEQNLTFDQKDELFKRIISETDEDDIRLQYTCARGISRLQICETKEAIRIVQSAVDQYRSTKKDERSLYGKHLFAHALQLLGALKHDNDLIKESAERFLSILESAEESGLTEFAFANYLCEVGRCQALLGEHTNAIEYYIKSGNRHPEPLTQVYLASSYVEKGDEESARDILMAIKGDDLSDVNRQDFAIACSTLAAKSCKGEDINLAVAELKRVSPRDPYFVRTRDECLVALLETEPIARQGKLRTLLQSINRYLMLNPNLCGIGVNVNNILEDMDRDAE